MDLIATETPMMTTTLTREAFEFINTSLNLGKTNSPPKRAVTDP